MRIRLLICLLACLTPVLKVSLTAAEANLVLEWNAAMLRAIRTDNSSPTLAPRNLAILHTAIYDAINSVEQTHQPYRFLELAPVETSAEAAAVGAAYEVMQDLYPNFLALAQDLYEQWVTNAPPTLAVQNGLELGRKVAQMTVEDRNTDGASTDVPYIPSAAPGQWLRTPPFFRPPIAPQWRYVTPFCLPDLEPFLPPGPPALESQEYADAFNEVKVIGGTTSTLRTAQQTQIATFWSDFSYTATPAGHWTEIAAAIATIRQSPLAETARLFALLTMAQTDAGIACWEAKYRHNFWRPVTAIRRANEDNNPLTEMDVTWKDQLNAPSFPAYISGHSAFSKASSEVLENFYGTDEIEFTATSDSLPGVFRTFHSLAACADECGMSRIYGGIHFIFEKEHGKTTGKKVADFVTDNFLLSNEELPALRLEGVSTGSATLRLHGHLGTVCVLQVSTDLATWRSSSTNAAVTGGAVVTEKISPEAPLQFYRVVEQ